MYLAQWRALDNSDTEEGEQTGASMALLELKSYLYFPSGVFTLSVDTQSELKGHSNGKINVRLSSH